MANNGESVLEKLLGCLHIPFLAERVNQPGCHLRQWRDTDNTISPSLSRRFHPRTTTVLLVRAVWSAIAL
jgi:hypothetical protein